MEGVAGMLVLQGTGIFRGLKSQGLAAIRPGTRGRLRPKRRKTDGLAATSQDEKRPWKPSFEGHFRGLLGIMRSMPQDLVLRSAGRRGSWQNGASGVERGVA